MRIFLSAYIQDGDPDINALVGTVSDQVIDSYRIGFGLDDLNVDIEHFGMIRPMALLRLAYSYAIKPDKEKVGGIEIPLILKTHAANAVVTGMRLIPPVISKKVVYIVRDPRDVAISYKKHFDLSMDETVAAMVDGRNTLFDKDNDEKPPHHVASWTQNLYSYASAQDLDVLVIKYEQLKEDPVRYFKQIIAWYEIPLDMDRVQRAVDACELSKLRKLEKQHGFVETSNKADKFFGKGEVGGWEKALTRKQRNVIEEACRPMMIEFGYLEG